MILIANEMILLLLSDSSKILNVVTSFIVPDGLLRLDISLQTLDAFHLGICCDRFCFPPIRLY